MRYIYNDGTDPYFNLAAEEYLARNCVEDIFMLWRNSSSVIIGKNQNALAEVDLDYAEKEKIPVIRRMTGGGAVFHDLGNVNYTFITKGSGDIDFERFATPVISALAGMGVAASLGGRNDIVSEGYKISGNAQCRVNAEGGFVTLHHGTLLFGADLSKLSAVLRPNPLKLKAKGIKSVSSRVKNIKDIESYGGPSTPEGFISDLFRICGGVPSVLSASEKDGILTLAKEKYRTWDWNFGETPSFEIKKEGRFPFGTLCASFSCRKGKIESIKFSGDFFGDGTEILEEALCGVVFEKKAVFEKLLSIEPDIFRYIHGADAKTLCSLLFESWEND